MLPDVRIDCEDYDEILEEALNVIISLYPEWTDFNAHDPGITMLELFAVMKESQQFFANRIGEQNRLKFLKLLGVHRRTKKPARSLIKIKADNNDMLLQAHKTDAHGLCFETVGVKQLIKKDIQLCMAVRKEQVREILYQEQLTFGHGIYVGVFGEAPEYEDCFYIGFEQALPKRVLLDLYTAVYKAYEVTRNPLNDKPFQELVTIAWQYYTHDGWTDVKNLCDETHGFLFDGFIRFTVDKDMEETCVMGQTKYFIRAVLKEGAYDIAPILTDISMNVCEVVQTDTLVECICIKNPQSYIELDTELSVLGTSEILIETDGRCRIADSFIKEINHEQGKAQFLIEDATLEHADSIMVINRELSFVHKRKLGFGNGFPNQEIDLEELQVEYESFALMVVDTEKGGYRLWDKVRDFSNSSPSDRHYLLDTRRGIVLFGDCIHGMAPEGEMILIGYATTAGKDGNVKTGAINTFRMELLRECEIFNICEGVGGQDEETLEESFKRAKQTLREDGCAVTKRDYEQYVKQTPGLMIESCQVISIDNIRKFTKKTDETAVYLVVKPYGNSNMAGKSYYLNIRNYLEDYRTLGSRIYIFFPEYIAVSVYVEAVVKPQYPDIGKRLQEVVSNFFEQYKNAFGGTVSYSRLYGFLDRQDFITEVRSLNLEAKGNGVKRSRDGDLALLPYGIAILNEVKAFLM